MKCPYRINTKQVEQTDYDLNDNDIAETFQTITIETKEFADCVKENCAAWINGRCQQVLKG